MSNESVEETGWVELVPGGPVEGSIRPPGSKSITNRALVCAAFAEGPSTLSGALRSEDTNVMINALRACGVAIDATAGGRTLSILGVGERRPTVTKEPIELFIANSGTTVRFLTAALSALGGNFRLHGVERMHARPIRDLVDAIDKVIEGKIEAISPGGCPPVSIHSHGWVRHQMEVGGAISSQYLSGLMMAGPLARRATPQPVEIAVKGELVSKPYVQMTAEVMRAFGVEVTIKQSSEDHEQVQVAVAAGRYRGQQYEIEPDASAASYFWATAAISGGKITVEGLSQHALQGDVGFCEVLRQMGCQVDYGSNSITVAGRGALRGVDVDMNEISDTVQTIAVVALFADGPTRVRGVAHNRFKETDRIGDLARELRKLGAEVTEHDDGLTIGPAQGSLSGAELETYHDHRMAMSLALAGLRVPGVRVVNPACTGKTYPEFFADLERLLGRAHRWA